MYGSVPGPPPPIPPIASPKRERDPTTGEILDESADKKVIEEGGERERR